MHFHDQPAELIACQEQWARRGFVPLPAIFQAAGALFSEGPAEALAMRLCQAFNGGPVEQKALREAAGGGDHDAANLAAWMAVHGLDAQPARRLPRERAQALEARLLEAPEAFVARGEHPYPFSMAERHLGFDPGWARRRLQDGTDRFAALARARRSDIAVLVGNGPSLARIDLETLRGQEVFISNYAIRHPLLRELARGVAVSNPLVAEQEPHVFQTNNLWKFHPVWLGHILGDGPQTVWLNALGGPLFFSEDVTRKIAWHATVSHFWLQILYGAGYRRVLLIGMDNAYRQDADKREGDLIHQEQDDPNHFDPAYFKGKVWQAADTGHMAATYRLAREVFEADGREVVNCSAGGRLETFRRAALSDELART